VGTYNPVLSPAEVKINEELALKWLQNGAKPSDTVRNLFSSQGILEKFHNAKNSK
ncbi:30S ribosomal protein S16, partial [Bacillus pumilus]